jgi:hypothetical protein
LSASRTLLNKQGRKPGLLASARAAFPVSRQRRMNTPHGMLSTANRDRIVSNIVRVATGN